MFLINDKAKQRAIVPVQVALAIVLLSLPSASAVACPTIRTATVSFVYASWNSLDCPQTGRALSSNPKGILSRDCPFEHSKFGSQISNAKAFPTLPGDRLEKSFTMFWKFCLFLQAIPLLTGNFLFKSSLSQPLLARWTWASLDEDRFRTENLCISQGNLHRSALERSSGDLPSRAKPATSFSVRAFERDEKLNLPVFSEIGVLVNRENQLIEFC